MLSRSALQVPYLAVRMPLGLLDEQVVVRVLGADSTVHRVLAGKLQQLDALAAGAFGAPGDTAPADNATAPAPAAPTQPAERVDDLPADEQQEITELADTFEAEQELAPRAGELAEDSEIRRVQAEIRAKQTVEDGRGQL